MLSYRPVQTSLPKIVSIRQESTAEEISNRSTLRFQQIYTFIQ